MDLWSKSAFIKLLMIFFSFHWCDLVISILLPHLVSLMNVNIISKERSADSSFINFRFESTFKRFFLHSFIDQRFDLLILVILHSIFVLVKLDVSFLIIVCWLLIKSLTNEIYWGLKWTHLLWVWGFWSRKLSFGLWNFNFILRLHQSLKWWL